jgi:hypothetical protein
MDHGDRVVLIDWCRLMQMHGICFPIWKMWTKLSLWARTNGRNWCEQNLKNVNIKWEKTNWRGRTLTSWLDASNLSSNRQCIFKELCAAGPWLGPSCHPVMYTLHLKQKLSHSAVPDLTNCFITRLGRPWRYNVVKCLWYYWLGRRAR